MAEETEPAEVTMTDVFQQQQKTIETLVDVFKQQGSTQPQQIIYASPTEAPKKAAPNYLLWIGIAVAVFTLFKKGKK